jgi:hypothetical protein
MKMSKSPIVIFQVSFYKRNKLLVWELLGILFMTLLGSLFHFTYEWSGENWFVGTFSAVNESAWEHLKLLFFPLIIFAAIEYWYIRKEANNFIVAKTIGSYVSVSFILGVFYLYTTLTGLESLIIDILIFIGSVVVAQLLGYWIMKRPQMSKLIERISWIALISLGVMFILFTFYPPDFLFFQEP